MNYLSDVLEWRAVSKLIFSLWHCNIWKINILILIYTYIYIYIDMKLIAVPKRNENNV